MYILVETGGELNPISPKCSHAWHSNEGWSWLCLCRAENDFHRPNDNGSMLKSITTMRLRCRILPCSLRLRCVGEELSSNR